LALARCRKGDLAVGGRVEVDEQAQQCTLAAPAFAHNGNKLAWRDIEIEMFQHCIGAEALVEAAYADADTLGAEIRGPAGQGAQFRLDLAA
jgi:hypothetical protein